MNHFWALMTIDDSWRQGLRKRKVTVFINEREKRKRRRISVPFNSQQEILSWSKIELLKVEKEKSRFAGWVYIISLHPPLPPLSPSPLLLLHFRFLSFPSFLHIPPFRIFSAFSSLYLLLILPLLRLTIIIIIPLTPYSSSSSLAHRGPSSLRYLLLQ